MNTLLQKAAACLIITLFLIGNVASLSHAQKKFEGYWEQQTIRNSTFPGQPKNATETEITYYKPGMFKTENKTTGKVMIFRFDKGLMWDVDTKRNTYRETTFQQMEEMTSMMKKQMQNMSAEEKKMMSQMMGKSGGSMIGEDGGVKFSVKHTGARKSISGFSCEQIFLNLDNEPFMEMWISDKYKMGDEFLKVYEKMGFMKGDISEASKKIQGIPIYSKMNMDMGMGKMETETTIQKIVPKSLSTSEFDLPKGLKKIESQMPF